MRKQIKLIEIKNEPTVAILNSKASQLLKGGSDTNGGVPIGNIIITDDIAAI
jgi:hypothetical protein